MTRTCWIIYNGYLQGNKFRDYGEMLQEAAHEHGHEAILYTNNELSSVLSKELSISRRHMTALPDYVIFTDKDLYLAKQLELLHIRVFNPSSTIAVTDDKISTYQTLAAHKLPIPKTMIAPKTFGLSFTEDDPFIKQILKIFSFPFIVKEAYGSFGEQVYLVQDELALFPLLQQVEASPFLVQEFIETSYGRDVRIQVVGDKVITSMKRTALNDFRANITHGGQMELYEPSEKEMQIAIAATKAVGADFAGIDLLFGPNNEPIICEVNSNAHIRNLLDCTGVNVAPTIIQYIDNILEAKNV